jgi:TATA-box binding protein (TBP) (component of TFIID and TFIIIB)
MTALPIRNDIPNLDHQLYKSKIDILNLPYDLEISTTTITCHLGIIFNVENIGLYFNDFDNIIIGKRYGNRIVNNLINIKKVKTDKKKKRREKKNFYNQVSIIFRSCSLMGIDPEKLSLKERNKTVNIKLFINGSIQMTGCKHLDNIKKSLEILFDKLKNTKAILDKNMVFQEKTFVDDISKLRTDNITNFKIVMINTNFNIMFQINRERLYELLKVKGFDVTFDPIIHACVNIKYNIKNMPNKTISIFVFESGSITIAGSNSSQQVLETYNFINKFILSNYKKLLTKNITPQLIIQLLQDIY